MLHHSIIDKTKYTGDLVLSAVSGLGAQALTDKQRAITQEALAQLAAGKPFTPHVIAYRGLLDEDIDPGTNGSIGLAILHQMDHYPKSAPLDLSCCGKQLDGGGGGVGRTNEHREDAEMRSIFDKASPGEYDPEANGEVTRGNLIAALPAAMRAVVTDAMFDALDEDKTGTFSFEEVSLLLARCNDEGEVEQMRLLFNRMDTDESGTITAEEPKTVLPVSVSEEHVDALVEEFDTNGDGLFTFNEVKGMFPRLRELGAGSLPIPYCQALLHPIESLKSTSMEMAQYFLSLRFMCFMYCTMCIFGAALIACNWVINDNLIQYRVLLNDTALPAIIGTLPYTSSFPSVFLASYSYQSFFEREKMFPTIPDDAWNLLATAEIIHTVITVVILCFLVWALGALNDQIRGSEELLDKGVTSCSDFTLEVTCIPPSATAVQLGHVFRRWGEVAKVTLHFPIRSSLVDHTNVISQSVTNLRYAQRKDDIVANITSNGKHLKVPHQASILAMAENKTLQEIDTAKEKETIAEELVETMAAVVKGGKPKPLTNAPTPFATAFVSFMHEADRSECEKSFADSTSINWSVFLGLEKPPQVLGEDGSDLNTNPYLFDQRWSHGLGMTPAHWRGEWSRYFRERLKGPGRKVFSRPEWFGVFIPVGTNDTDDILNLSPDALDASSGHTRCSTLQFICAQRVKLFCGCTLRVKRAPEPKDIRWKNIHIATCSKFLRYLVLITVLTTFCGLVSLLSAAYIVVSGFGDKMKENNFIRRTFSSFSPTFNQFLFNIAPLAISQLNLVTKLIGTKALVPALSNYIRHRSESAFTATVLVCTFAVETMQTAFLITASFVLATMSSRPYSDGDLAGEDSTPVPLIDAQTGNNVMQALGYYLFIVCVNSAFALMLMDSPGMLPVWIGRLVGTLPKITTCLGCKCLKEPQQYELDNKWRAPSSPIHIWTSKLAGSLVAVCAVGPWYPLMYFGAAFQVTTMLLCELWALLRLHSKPDPRGFEVAHISAMIYRACLGICFVSTL